MPEPPRSTAQRQEGARELLRREVDAWVASADADGRAYLVPLSYCWDGARLVLATPARSRTARNLRRAGWARVAIGPPRDVVMVEGPLTFTSSAEIDAATAQAHAAATGFDARGESPPYVYIALTPERIQTWRSNAELAGRDILRDGAWVATE